MCDPSLSLLSHEARELTPHPLLLRSGVHSKYIHIEVVTSQTKHLLFTCVLAVLISVFLLLWDRCELN